MMLTALLAMSVIAVSATAQSKADEPIRACDVTEPIRAEPPRDPNADPFGSGPWYVNADRTIWAGWDAVRMGAGEKGNKVLWIRPQGSQLTVSGRRLDADAASMKARVPCCYPTGFQASGLFFPTAGCWEITAKAGKSELRFVTRVSPEGRR